MLRLLRLKSFKEDAMSNFKEMWPLAFVLAMASGASRADAPIDTNPAAFFRAGSLADALRNSSDVGEGSERRSGIGPTRLAQWFNFFNCFSGVWRKC
jgi:hypothetical protein